MEFVRNGKIIIYPTDTIYGLGCNPFEANAVRRIYEIKRRGENMPFILLANTRSMVETLASVSGAARELMRRFWPGPLTMIFPVRTPIPLVAEKTIALRIPRSRLCLQLIAGVGVPLVSTSANLSGDKVIAEPSLLAESMRSSVDLILDAGRLDQSKPSTIVDVSGSPARIIREGAVSAAAIWRALRSVI